MWRENSRLGKWPYSLRNFNAAIQEKKYYEISNAHANARISIGP